MSCAVIFLSVLRFQNHEGVRGIAGGGVCDGVLCPGVGPSLTHRRGAEADNVEHGHSGGLSHQEPQRLSLLH